MFMVSNIERGMNYSLFILIGFLESPPYLIILIIIFISFEYLSIQGIAKESIDIRKFIIFLMSPKIYRRKVIHSLILFFIILLSSIIIVNINKIEYKNNEMNILSKNNIFINQNIENSSSIYYIDNIHGANTYNGTICSNTF